MRKINWIAMLTALFISAILTSRASAMYNPMLGRFMQEDPLGYSDSLNAYLHGCDNPVNRMDPTGLKKILVMFEGACGFPGGDVQKALQGDGRFKLHNDFPFNSVSGGGYDLLNANAGEQFKYIHHGTGAWGPGFSGNSNGVNDAIKDIKHDLENKCHNASIAVIGHSWGGDAAWEFLGRLNNELHVRANLVATFDPRPRADGNDYKTGFWTKEGIYAWDNVKPVDIAAKDGHPKWTADWTNYFREGLDKNGNLIGDPTGHSMILGGYALPGPTNVPDRHPEPNAGMFGGGNHWGIVNEFIDQFITKFRAMPEEQ